jgi:hypothetical protein
MRLRAPLGLALFALIALTVSATAVQAQEGRCRGGPNNGEPCTSDADCPGSCRANVAHPLCDDATPCVNVCQGGDTPGAACPDGLCPGVCEGGDNAGAACMKLHDPTCSGGGRCNARCGRDQCQRGVCRFRTAAGMLEPADPQEEETDSVACLLEETTD